VLLDLPAQPRDAVERPGLANRNVKQRAYDSTNRRNLSDVIERYPIAFAKPTKRDQRAEIRFLTFTATPSGWVR